MFVVRASLEPRLLDFWQPLGRPRGDIPPQKPPLHVDISAAVTLKAAFYGPGFGRANTAISRITQVASRVGSRWSRQEVRPLCTGRHDPITCLGSEGCTGFPRGEGQEASVVVKGLSLGQTRMGSTPSNLTCQLYNCDKLPDRAIKQR